MAHLGDEQIQAYLDNASGNDKELFEKHLISCPDCKKRAAEYESLYLSLSHEREDSLPSDFTSKVMAEIRGDSVPEVIEESAPERDYSFVLAFAGIAVLISSVLYFVDLSKLIFYFESSNLLVILENYYQSIGTRTAEYIPFDTNLILMVVLTLAALKAIDYAIQHHRRKSVTFVI